MRKASLVETPEERLPLIEQGLAAVRGVPVDLPGARSAARLLRARATILAGQGWIEAALTDLGASDAAQSRKTGLAAGS